MQGATTDKTKQLKVAGMPDACAVDRQDKTIESCRNA
jgi:hypothetical protein